MELISRRTLAIGFASGAAISAVGMLLTKGAELYNEPLPISPTRLYTKEAVVHDFMGAETARIMQVYSDFYWTTINRNYQSFADFSNFVYTIQADLDSADVTRQNRHPAHFRARRHRLDVLPALFACHRYTFSHQDFEREYGNTIVDALTHKRALLREILYQNLITSIPACANTIYSCQKGGLLFQNEAIMDVIINNTIASISQPEDHSSLCSLLIFLLNVRRLSKTSDPVAASKANLVISAIQSSDAPELFHLKQLAETFTAAHPQDMLGLQPTECLMGWQALSRNVGTRYLFWIAIERCRHLFTRINDRKWQISTDFLARSKEEDEAHRLIGVLRTYNIFDRLIRPNINLLRPYSTIDPIFYRFMNSDLESILLDESKISEQHQHNLVQFAKNAPYSQNNPFYNVSNQRNREDFSSYFNYSKLFSIFSTATIFNVACLAVTNTSLALYPAKKTTHAPEAVKEIANFLEEGGKKLESEIESVRNDAERQINEDAIPVGRMTQL